jgi:diaminohydroxyphosphoribosylaminopyrimidine deaminase/5-amino-6-(5-phosphoribosylamino)uracil reductase
MFTPAETGFMRQALALAGNALWLATPNPRVGCVLVRDGEVIGEGWTQPPGGHHAEAQALVDARARGHDPQGATAFVTLEPCAHQGRTPPCSRALVQARVARVIAAIEDPNPLVAGRGLAELRAAGIEVRCGLLADEAREVNAGFLLRMSAGRPWVRVKLALSLDGRAALPDGRSQWITGPQARADAHAWRARSCALLTGAGTVRSDDPQLTVREVQTPRQPLRAVVMAAGSLPAGARLRQGPAPVLYSLEGAPATGADPGGMVVPCPPDAQGRVALGAVLHDLASRGCNEVMVEAGPRLAGALFQAGLVDELLVYLAPVLLGPGRPALELPLAASLEQAARLRIHESAQVGPDLRLLLRR